MFLSVFDIFKVGIGPSSSHTVGPMVAARRFIDELRRQRPANLSRVSLSLHGSLAFTGKGHGSDRAIILGLAGEQPESIDPDRTDEIIAAMAARARLPEEFLPNVAFDPERDIIFDYGPALAGHSNGLTFTALDADGAVLHQQIFYSIGGGFVITAEELEARNANLAQADNQANVPYGFSSAAEMLEMGQRYNLSIGQMKRANECVSRNADDVSQGLRRIWRAMDDCMRRGLRQTGTLPGGLKVKRRAGDIHNKLVAEQGLNQPYKHTMMDWLSVYAMAVNEENAAGGKVVTAPTNGAAGVIPAVIRYYFDHCPDTQIDHVEEFLLVSAAIGGIIKHNASISGAEVGCQGEVGSASAMAAAGLCAVLGGSNEQIENAAEIALEHHLGMTCDPVGGLVQVPCIERNALGSVKAVNAASLALRGDGKHFVSLDQCVETMRQTGHDMNEKYKETSTGGLAVNVVEC